MKKLIIRLSLLLINMLILSGCISDKPYKAMGEKKASLIIDAPYDFEPSLIVTAFDKQPSVFSEPSLIYGGKQIKDTVEISANQMLFLNVVYNFDYTTYCSLNPKFVPDANKVYRLTIGTQIGKENCYVSVTQIINNEKLLPVKLEKWTF